MIIIHGFYQNNMNLMTRTLVEVILGSIWTASLVSGLCSEQVLDGSKSESCNISRNLRYMILSLNLL